MQLSRRRRRKLFSHKKHLIAAWWWAHSWIILTSLSYIEWYNKSSRNSYVQPQGTMFSWHYLPCIFFRILFIIAVIFRFNICRCIFSHIMSSIVAFLWWIMKSNLRIPTGDGFWIQFNNNNLHRHHQAMIQKRGDGIKNFANLISLWICSLNWISQFMQ